MAVTTPILTIDDFTNKADISNNIKTSKLEPYIEVIQDQFGPKMLCELLYQELQDQICTSTLSAVNTLLLPFVKNYLIYKTYARYLVNANIIATPAGLRIQLDTTSVAATSEDLAPIVSQAETDANSYQDKLANFLIENETDYPLWKDSICNCKKSLRAQKQNQFSLIGKKSDKVDLKWT